jgi:hypothetical protein
VFPFEVTATDGTAGHVAVMRGGTAGVRAIHGKLTVRNLKTSESFVLTKGQERFFTVNRGVNAPPLAEIASNVPGPVPAPVPQAPAGRTSGGLAMDTGAWLAVIGGAAVAGIAIWGLIIALDNRDDVKDLKSTINNLNTTLTANQQLLKNISNASAIANTAAQSQAQLATITALAGQAQTALAVAGNTTAAAQAASLSAQAASVQSQLNAVQSQISALQAQFAAGGGSSAQLSTLLSQEETLRNQANSLATQLNNLLNANRNTPGVPQTQVGTVGPPVLASASVPV